MKEKLVLQSPNEAYVRDLLERWNRAYELKKKDPTPEHIQQFESLDELKHLMTLSIIFAASK